MDGNRVYPAGMFGVVGGNIPAMNIAMWDGSSWDTMAGGTDRAVYDGKGRRVVTLVSGARPEGINNVSWDRPQQ